MAINSAEWQPAKIEANIFFLGRLRMHFGSSFCPLHFAHYQVARLSGPPNSNICNCLYFVPHPFGWTNKNQKAFCSLNLNWKHFRPVLPQKTVPLQKKEKKKKLKDKHFKGRIWLSAPLSSPPNSPPPCLAHAAPAFRRYTVVELPFSTKMAALDKNIFWPNGKKSSACR